MYPRARGLERGRGSQQGPHHTEPCSYRKMVQGLWPLFKEQQAATGMFWTEGRRWWWHCGRGVLTAEWRMGWMGVGQGAYGDASWEARKDQNLDEGGDSGGRGEFIQEVRVSAWARTGVIF